MSVDLVFGQRGRGMLAVGAPTARSPVDVASLSGLMKRTAGRPEIVIGLPTLSAEKELAQATGRAETAGLTDRQALHAVLSQRQNRYLARQLCYVLTIEGLETYLLQPRDLADVELLVDAIRPAPRPTDIDVVIGRRGPLAPPELC